MGGCVVWLDELVVLQYQPCEDRLPSLIGVLDCTEGVVLALEPATGLQRADDPREKSAGEELLGFSSGVVGICEDDNDVEGRFWEGD